MSPAQCALAAANQGLYWYHTGETACRSDRTRASEPSLSSLTTGSYYPDGLMLEKRRRAHVKRDVINRPKDPEKRAAEKQDSVI